MEIFPRLVVPRSLWKGDDHVRACAEGIALITNQSLHNKTQHGNEYIAFFLACQDGRIAVCICLQLSL